MNNKIVMTGKSLTIITEKGNIYSSPSGNLEMYNKLSAVTTEEEIRQIILPELYQKEEEVRQKIVEQEKQIKIAEQFVEKLNILVETGDFEIKENNTVYMKGINRSLPQLLINKFITVLIEASNFIEEESLEIIIRNNSEYNSLIRFWQKCCLNPNAHSAESLYPFLEKWGMKIDKHGNFYAFRRVVSKSNGNKELIEFVSAAYIKQRVRKKSTSIPVYKNSETLEYSITAENDYPWEFIGELKELYLSLPDMQENNYTSNHTGLEDYRVGTIISMPRNEGDDNNNISCSKGFHGCDPTLYSYTEFGDTTVLMIVSPTDVLAVPDAGKFRCCRWYFAAVVENTDILNLPEFDLEDLGDDFEALLMETLKEDVHNGFAEEVKRHTFSIPKIYTSEIKTILNALNPALYEKELSSRVNSFDDKEYNDDYSNYDNEVYWNYDLEEDY